MKRKRILVSSVDNIHQMISWAAQTAAKAYVGSKAGTPLRLAADEFVNAEEKLRDKVKPRRIYNAPKDIDFALLSKSAYNEGGKRNVEGYDILTPYSSPDRVVYQHKRTKHVILAFRGTDARNWKNGFSSKGFRDITSDILLAGAAEGLSHRFTNAEEITQKLITQFGKENVTVTGHSLGGSEAMHVSKKFDVGAHVYNPHTTWASAITGGYYPQVTLHVNETDPVSMFYRGSTFKQVDSQKHGLLLKAHGLKNFIHTKQHTPDVGPSYIPRAQRLPGVIQ
jgi:hypothetical protein